MLSLNNFGQDKEKNKQMHLVMRTGKEKVDSDCLQKLNKSLFNKSLKNLNKNKIAVSLLQEGIITLS